MGRMYKCKYRHCLKPEEKIVDSKCVLVGKQRFHPECAELHEKIECIKRIYFDFIDSDSDYVQVVGVINNLIFRKNYSVNLVEFLMKYIVAYQCKVKSPYSLHLIIKNGLVEEYFSNDKKRMDVIARFDYRTRGY